MKKIINRNFLILLIACLTIVAGGMYSCNKDFPNDLKDEFNDDLSSLNLGTRKALVVVLDGAVGSEVKKLSPPNLTLLSDFAIYSYDALSDYNSTEPMTPQIGWANMMTGVYEDKHQVSGSDISDIDSEDYPSFITRLKEMNKVEKTAVFSTSQPFVDNLAAAADVKEIETSDADIISNAVATLKEDDDVSLVVVHLSDIEKAGLNGTFLSTDAGYKEAVLAADAEIGKLLGAMRSRTDFAKENWLVVVASGNGSVDSDDITAATNAYNDTRRNGLFFAFNPRFNSLAALRPGTLIPYIGTTPQYNGKKEGSLAQVLDDDGLYDFGDNGSFTIQCKVKIKAGNYYYPAVLGKREEWSGGHPGWVFFLEGDYWQINFGQEGQGNSQIRGASVNDGQWHTLTAVIRQEGSNRMVYTFTDGVKWNGSLNIASKGNINTTRPLIAGHFAEDGGSGPDEFFVTDIRIYDTDLSDDYIAENYARIDVPDDDPYFDNLLGFWKANSIATTDDGGSMKDFSKNNKPMTITKDALNPVNFNDLTVNVRPDLTPEVYRIVPNAVDVATQVYLWFGVIVDESWNLDGNSWIPTYIDLNN